MEQTKGDEIMGTKITDHYFEFGALKYFRGNAHRVEIGTYGQKIDPIGAKSHLEPQNKVKREIIAEYVQEGKPIGADWSETTQTELMVNGNVMVFGVNASAAIPYDYDRTRSASLKLYNLAISEGPLKKMLNNEADGARKFLADEGNDSRIVSEVWVVMEAELAEHFSTSGGFAISASAAGSELNITAKGGKHGTQTISLAPGTTFAYALSKVKNWTEKKTHIDNMSVDYYGMS